MRYPAGLDLHQQTRVDARLGIARLGDASGGQRSSYLDKRPTPNWSEHCHSKGMSLDWWLTMCGVSESTQRPLAAFLAESPTPGSLEDDR